MEVSLDIIIPCYNAKDTLFDTLSSIAVQQKVKNFRVYLVNDCSSYDYSFFVSHFSSYFSIEEIKLKKNLGPGGARREGMKHSNSDFIMFIDSDDVFYNCFSIYEIYRHIKVHQYDVVISNFILERDGVRIIKKKDHIWLHGKIYRRSFLNDNNIEFNNSRANEDNGFNRLILMLNANVGYLDKITYIYSENSNSITRINNRRYKIDGLEGFIYNMKWAIEEALKRGVTSEAVHNLSYAVLMSMYFDYLRYIDDSNVKKILVFSKDMLPYYLPYKNLIPKHLFNTFCKNKEEEFKLYGVKVKYSISFDEFIEKVIKCN